MSNPRTIRTALVARLRTIAGLHAYERWPGQLNPPCIVVDLIDAEPEQAMGAVGARLTRYDFDLNIMMPLAGGWENAQDRLDPLLATSSTGGVFGAIAGDRTLGGTVHSTFVKGLPRDYERRVIDESIEVLAATVPIEIWAS